MGTPPDTRKGEAGGVPHGYLPGYPEKEQLGGYRRIPPPGYPDRNSAGRGTPGLNARSGYPPAAPRIPDGYPEYQLCLRNRLYIYPWTGFAP